MNALPAVADAITSEEVLGKDVIDATGAFIGVTDKLFLHKKTLKVLGISVDKGFLRSGLVIGADYIREVTPHAVFLTIEPVFRMKGMLVFDRDGAKIGTALEVHRIGGENRISELAIKQGLGKPTITVPASAIARVDNNIFLTVTQESLAAKTKKILQHKE